jgi:ABC-type dipeptide/oligopeptide/nickel transport system ATPase component
VSTSILEVRDLHVRIASRRGIVRAVDGVSFDVPRGGALGLVGESGSGKSMTLRAILGVLPAEAQVTSGEIRLDGVDLRQLRGSDINRLRGPKMAMIFQEPMSALNPVMRVGWQIAEGPQVHLGLNRSRAAERALELMRRVGIPDPERRFRAYPHEFSGGMRQRVMIAMALSCDPEIILCDEPTTALDVTIQDQILRCGPAVPSPASAWCSSPTTCRWSPRSAATSRSCTAGRSSSRVRSARSCSIRAIRTRSGWSVRPRTSST